MFFQTQFLTLVALALSVLHTDIAHCLLQFNEPVYAVTVNETPANDSDVIVDHPAPETGVLITVSCTSINAPPVDSTEIRYSILEGAVDTTFTINEITGEFSVAADQSFDYEEKSWYLVNLSCYLVSNTSNNAIATVNVSIGPVNEYIPTFVDVSSNIISIREDTRVGTKIAGVDASIGPLVTYTFSDRDSGPDGVIIYSLNDDPTTFELDRISGTLSLNTFLDVDNSPEEFETVEVSINACNEGITRSMCPVIEITVFVTGANDNAPQYDPSNYTGQLLESAINGSLVIQPICIDDDIGLGSALSYSFYKDTSELLQDTFQLTTTGAILLVGPLDYETGVVNYQFEIVCSDGKSEALAQINVMVLPVNDIAPQFNEDNYEFSVDRISPSGHTVGQVQAEDNDIDIGNNITYSINGTSSFFSINSLTGHITVRKSIPSSEGSQFELQILANDGKYTAFTSVSISVEGAVTLSEFAGILSGVLIFIVLLVTVILLIGLCSCLYIRATRKRAYAVERATLTADITPGRKVVRFSDEVYPSEPPPLVVTNRQAGRRSQEGDDSISHTTFTRLATTSFSHPVPDTDSTVQSATTTDGTVQPTDGRVQHATTTDDTDSVPAATDTVEQPETDDEEETSFTN